MPLTNTSSHHIAKSNDIPQSSSTANVVDDQDTTQSHQYECIPEYLLTMNRHHHPPPIICHHLYHQTNNTCGVPYATFSRSYLLPQEMTTTNTSESSQCTCSSPPSATTTQEESSTPLLTSAVPKKSHKIGETSSPKLMMIGWTRRNSSLSTKRKSTEQRFSFLSKLRKSSKL
jgi:hypothetical protein